MAKTKPGLPDGFKLNLESPAQLGDYLDEGFDEEVARAYVAKQRTVVAQPARLEEPTPAREVRAQPEPQPRPHIVPDLPERTSEPRIEPRYEPRNEQRAEPQVVQRPEPRLERPIESRIAEQRAEVQSGARNDQVLNLAEARRRVVPRAPVAKRPERMQFNMRPETQKMFNELVEFVQRYSLQDDAKASEILDAMISVLYQSRDQLAFHDVPRRGKWGTPTARAFPTALGNAFARAIAGSFAKSGRGEG